MKLKNVELNFVNLLKPSSYGDQKPKFSTMVVFPVDHPQVEELQEAIDEAKVDEWGPKASKMPKLRSPLKKSPYISGKGEEIIPDGFYYMTASTGYNEDRPNNGRPVVVDAKMNPIDSGSDVYSGCIANVAFNVATYNLDTSKGVTCYLQGVQVIDKGQRKDGGVVEASQIFEQEDGFTRDVSGFEVEDDELNYGQAA